MLALSCKENKQEKAPAQKPDIYVPEDLEASLWATTPFFYNPTNMDVDARGRIWITEAANYRNFNNDSTKFLHHSQGDRVMILEDSNQDWVGVLQNNPLPASINFKVKGEYAVTDSLQKIRADLVQNIAVGDVQYPESLVSRLNMI